jgi:hypothetical protein
VKNWRKYIVLIIGSVLVLVSFVIYGVRVSKTFIPAGSTPQQILKWTQAYGIDRPVIEQYQWFLFTFLPGLTLLGIYATVGQGRQGFSHWILVKFFIVLMLITNTVTILNFLVTAHISARDTLWAFVIGLVVAGLALANFVFLLVIWNGYRWSAWAFGIASFVLCTLKFVGQVPVIPVLFELSSVIILIYLLRSAWPVME